MKPLHQLFNPTFFTLLALAATSSAQLSDLPNIATITDVLGASTSDAATKATSRDATAIGTRGASDAVTTTVSSYAGGLTNAPTLYGVGVPPLVVPDTSGAPFMHTSDLPEGFVFICVGATLAFLALCVLAWRGLVAWSLHRSVKRTASDRYMSEKKSSYGAPTDYSSTYYSTDVSMEHLKAKDTSYKGSTPHTQTKPHSKPSQRNSRQPTNSNLFFSPTAGGGQNAATRASTYLPAGYYASSGSALGAGSSLASFGGPPAAGYGRLDQTNMSPERRSRHNYDRSMSQERLSTLDAPRRDGKRQSHLRTSTHGSTSRAPSAMLDDLFDHHTGMK